MLIRISLVGLVAASPAFADGPTMAAPIAESVPAPTIENSIDWSGSYAGISLGSAAIEGEAERSGYSGALLTLDVENGLFPDRINDPVRSGSVGVRYGRNVQRGEWVTGFEIDLNFSDVTAEAGFRRVDPNPDPLFNGVDTITGYRTELDRMATARMRAGYATGPNLLYLTGGIAMADVRNTFSLDLPNLPAPLGPYSNSWSEQDWRLGYIFGAGIERKMTDRLSLSVDIVRFDLENVAIVASDPGVFGPNEISYEFTNAGYVARLGLNFAF